MDNRQQQLQHWLSNVLNHQLQAISPLAGDASFRRYFRVTIDGQHLVAMDAPPEHEETLPFIHVANCFSSLGLHVPKIIAYDSAKGFILMNDLGDELLLNILTTSNATHLYQLALTELINIQQCTTIPRFKLENFNQHLLMEELENFRHWLLQVHLQIDLDVKQQQMLDESFDFLKKSAEQQPQCCVHRDYHSRNLLLLADDNIGILDFQDAVMGPISYDVVSLLRDCYVDWPMEQVYQLAQFYFQQAQGVGLMPGYQFSDFKRWFDLVGIQRHLKASFIFARKRHRDNDASYLADIPRTLNYVKQVSAHYPELQALHHMISNLVIPQLEKHHS